ncbi:MAG TPA: TonB family protein [Ignavibacteria bacterium]
MSTENQNIETYEEPFLQKMKYGAPELLKSYKKFLIISLMLTFALFTSGIASYGVSIIIVDKNKPVRTGGLTSVELQNQNTENKDDENAPPPDVNTEKVTALKDDAALVPEPVAKERADTTKFKTQAELDKIKTVVSSEGDINADPNKEFSGELKTTDKDKIESEVKKDKEIKTEKKVYQTFEVEKAPVAVNLSQVRGSMRYPEIAKSSGIEGKVTVKVLVGPDGGVERVGSISGPDVFSDEVRDKVMSLQFTPALQNGKAVSCWVTVPFSFTLTGKFKKDTEEGDKKKEENP